jgi:hypothetical protein
MNELILKIEQWAEDRNLISGCKPIDQAMKLFSEAGELADNIGKGLDIKDDIGDVFVVLTIITRQLDNSLINVDVPKWAEGDSKNLMLKLNGSLNDFVECATFGGFSYGLCRRILNILNGIAKNNKTTLEECLYIAYNDIKDRKGIMSNGVFIKESDPAYESIVKSIEDNC